MKKLFKMLSISLSVLFMCTFLFSLYAYKKCPSKLNITSTNDLNINWDFPTTTKFINDEPTIRAGNYNNTSLEQKAQVLLFGCIPIKEISINYTETKHVIPCGTPFGIKIYTNGLIVVGINDVETADGKIINPCKESGIKEGDIIISANDEKITNNNQLINIINKSAGKYIKLEVKRDNNTFIFNIKPMISKSGEYKIGLWVRDSSAGIGTITFYDKDTNQFAGLGHGICDIDTGELLPIGKGEIVNVEINSLKKGIAGTPGELCGVFTSNNPIGILKINDDLGVYGIMDNSPINNEEIPIAKKQQVTKGNAQILTTINDEEPQYYDIEIVSINYSENQKTKNMIIKIKDETLISKTGGIVQGMSGSPIIQNGYLIGAVTHVFVNDPTKGYAVFAENMLDVIK